VADLAAEILAEIRQILSAELEITRPAGLDDELAADLELDSMGAIILAVGLEDRFRIRLSDEDAAEVVTVRDLVGLVQRRLSEAEAAGDESSPGREGAR